MTVMVTGAAGFVGIYMVEWLLRHGYSVVALGRDKNGKKAESRIGARLRKVNASLDLTNLVVLDHDVCEPQCGLAADEVEAWKGRIDCFIHAAADTRFEAKWATEISLTNVTGTRNTLWLACELACKKFCYVSTLFVCGKQNEVVLEKPIPVVPDRFNNIYELSKCQAESDVVSFCGEHDIGWSIARPGLIVGHALTGHTFVFNGYYSFIDPLYRVKEKFRFEKINVRFKMPGEPNYKLPIMPIDFVIESIGAIISRDLFDSAIFNLAPRLRPTNEWWIKTSAAFYGISGVTFHELPKSRLTVPARLTSGILSRLIKRQFSDYLPYITKDFDLEANMNRLGVEDPQINESFVSRLLKFATESKFRES